MLGKRLDQGGSTDESGTQTKISNMISAGALDGIKDVRPAQLNDIGSVEMLGLAASSNKHWQTILNSENKVSSIPVQLEGPGTFAMTVVGDSMVPAGLWPGQVVYCDSSALAAIGDAVFIRLKDGYATLKVFMGWTCFRPEEARLSVVNADSPKEDKWILLQGWDSPEKDDENKSQKPYVISVGSAMVELIAPVIFVRRKA